MSINGCPVSLGRTVCGSPMYARLTQVRRMVALNVRHEVEEYGEKTLERWEVWCERGHSITPRHFETLADGTVIPLQVRES